MLLIYLILGSIMMFQSGMMYSAYKIDLIEGRVDSKMGWWSLALGIVGLYFIISMVGRASVL